MIELMLRKESDSAQLFKRLENIRRSASRYISNIFVYQDTLESWISRGILYSMEAGGALLVLRRDRDFFHLYYAATDEDEFKIAIERLLNIETGIVSVDILGKSSGTVTELEVLSSCGFYEERRMVRFTNTAVNRGLLLPDDKEITRAEPEDARAIEGILLSMFDPYTEQVPSILEIQAYIRDSGAFVSRVDNKVVGLVLFQIIGVRSTVHYWAVLPEYKSCKLGTKLWRRYLYEARNSKRCTLWVSSTNTKVINYYQRAGYKPDGLLNVVMLRR